MRNAEFGPKNLIARIGEGFKNLTSSFVGPCCPDLFLLSVCPVLHCFSSKRYLGVLTKISSDVKESLYSARISVETEF